MLKVTLPIVAATALLLGACASTGSNGKYNKTAQDGAVGAAVGAVAGAVLAGDSNRAEGAILGGVLGGAAGAAYGCSRDKVCPWSSNNSHQSQLYYDSSARRNYYIDTASGDTYWESGEFRSGR